jgi:hypothetical protein
MAEPYYATVAELREEPEIPDDFDETEATRLLEQAEDLVDELLGAWPIDDASGRKIVEADVEDWQWAKLKRATLLLAVKLHQDPSLLEGVRWRSVSGPDFSTSQPVGAGPARFGAPVMAALNASQLRRLATRAAPGRRRRFASFLGATRHDGT